jgi:hypothetical protein
MRFQNVFTFFLSFQLTLFPSFNYYCRSILCNKRLLVSILQRDETDRREKERERREREREREMIE